MSVPNEDEKTTWNGVALGRVLGRVTAVTLALYVVSLIYRSDNEFISVVLVVFIILYALTSSARDIQYGYFPWEPVEWTPVHLDELDAEEGKRALRWTIALKSLLVVGAIGCLAASFAAGLETLGYVLLIGGTPTLVVKMYQHYSNGTRPWYPVVPSRLDGSQAE
ncbi:hypothetical protein [Halorussus pelagicus]|uniref:hypothetical protein n=1 Tax=Halorussus pelagicus TaxID=2505977 RepID=UPI000FFBBD8D|nr:hypothetical protein [Halorussus pelagicus]